MNTGNVFASDSVYATATLGAGEQATITTGTFNFDASMPASMSVTSVQLEFAGYSSVGNAWILYNGDRTVSRVMTGARVVYTIDISALVTLSRSYFLNATFQTTLTAIGGTSGGTFQLDYVKIIVNYDPAGTGSSTIETFGTVDYRAPEQIHVPRYQVEVRNLGQPTKHELVTIMDEYESMTITRKFQQPDEFSITFHRENKATDPLLHMYPIYDTDGVTLLGYKQQAVVRVLRDGHEEISSLIEKRSFRMAGSDPGTGHWTVSGWDLASGLLRRRTVLPTAGLDSDDQSAVTPGAAISHYVTNNYITPVTGGSGRGNSATGALSDLRIGYVTTRGFAVTWTAANQILTDMVTQICQSGAVGYRSYCDLAIGQAVIDIYAGVDRTFPDTTGGGILLSFGLENVLALEYEDDGFQVVNYVRVGGSGIGANRITSDVTSTYSINKYGQAESYYDWRMGGTSTAALTSAGQARVRSKASGERVSVTMIDNGTLGYRTKWDVGDTVTVAIPDVDVLTDLQIVQVTTTLNPGEKPTIAITFGTQPTTPEKVITQIQQDLFSATQQPPQEYGVTISREVVGHTAAADADFVATPRVGAIEIAKDIITSNVRIGVKTSTGWVTGPPILHNEVQPSKMLSGPGKVAATDGDFASTPPDGATAVVWDTSTGDIRLSVRGNGAWKTSGVLV